MINAQFSALFSPNADSVVAKPANLSQGEGLAAEFKAFLNQHPPPFLGEEGSLSNQQKEALLGLQSMSVDALSAPNEANAEEIAEMLSSDLLSLNSDLNHSIPLMVKTPIVQDVQAEEYPEMDQANELTRHGGAPVAATKLMLNMDDAAKLSLKHSENLDVEEVLGKDLDLKGKALDIPAAELAAMKPAGTTSIDTPLDPKLFGAPKISVPSDSLVQNLQGEGKRHETSNPSPSILSPQYLASKDDAAALLQDKRVTLEMNQAPQGQSSGLRKKGSPLPHLERNMFDLGQVQSKTVPTEMDGADPETSESHFLGTQAKESVQNNSGKPVEKSNSHPVLTSKAQFNMDQSAPQTTQQASPQVAGQGLATENSGKAIHSDSLAANAAMSQRAEIKDKSTHEPVKVATNRVENTEESVDSDEARFRLDPKNDSKNDTNLRDSSSALADSRLHSGTERVEPASSTRDASIFNVEKTELPDSERQEFSTKLAEKIESFAGRNVRSATITIEHQQLGELKVDIRLDNQKVDVTFLTSKLQASEILQGEQSALKESLMASQLELRDFSVGTGFQDQKMHQDSRQFLSQQNTDQGFGQSQEKDTPFNENGKPVTPMEQQQEELKRQVMQTMHQGGLYTPRPNAGSGSGSIQVLA